LPAFFRCTGMLDASLSLNLQGPSEAAAEYHVFDGGENGSAAWRMSAIGRHRDDLWLRETLSAR
jgi:hypothetical protein